ncbi:hypothetical protein [Shouchella clausii]|uniref:Apea-like HEPN domain-containing protein n=1 Tax=Shouchella clausii TaxID=79880 RepID=A0A268NUN6_SHOCL|nr:hypothetical protein [Shouchella clausii]PAE87223.1 hypothetical protein CHH72_19675 [Shouchella clausii]
MGDYWVVFPLVNATLDDTICLNESIYIIGGDKDRKLNQLAQVTNFPIKELDSRFEHTLRSRSTIFLSHPIIAIKIHHPYSSVSRIASDCAFYAISLLNVIYRAYIYPSYENTEISFVFRQLIEKGNINDYDKLNKHIAIHGEKNWTHIPINFSYYCNFDLKWLINEKYRKRFVNLYSWSQETKTNDVNELKERFLRAIRFFMKAINFGKESNLLDSESDSVLYINITAEVMLLKKNENKHTRKKLTFLLEHLVTLEGIDQTSVIDKVCKSRNEFVHDGLDYIDNYFYRNKIEPSEKEAKGKTDLEVFIKIIAILISKGDFFIEYATRYKKHSSFTTQESWFNLLADYFDNNQVPNEIVEVTKIEGAKVD